MVLIPKTITAAFQSSTVRENAASGNQNIRTIVFQNLRSEVIGSPSRRTVPISGRI
jgi:hypothetical protein